jgi:FixJ family two-component response regulator
MDDKLRVFVIDDDPLVVRSIERVLRQHGYDVEVFTNATTFLARAPYDGPACLLLDLRMPGIDGLDLQQTLLSRGITWPIVFVSGQGDISSATRAMREGAIDFLVKPLDESQLLQAAARAGERAQALHERYRLERDARERLARLTKRERQVCELVARGLLNKQIAYELGTVEKTVKVHRGRVMKKLEVDSVAALVRLLARLPADSRQRF